MTNTIIFFIALLFTIHFFGKLMAWVVYMIAPQNCEKQFTSKDIFTANLVMFIGVILWTILFYNLTNN